MAIDLSAFNQDQLDGITKARLVCNVAREADDRFDTNEDYATWVASMAGLEELPESAVDSYVEQHFESEIADLEAAIVAKDAPVVVE